MLATLVPALRRRRVGYRPPGSSQRYEGSGADVVTELADLLDVLELEPREGGFLARNVDMSGGAVVFGGQILAQVVMAGASVDPSKEVASVHTVFARGARLDSPLELTLDVLQTGRSFASTTVTVAQGDRLCARSLVLLSAPDPDLIRHQSDPPAAGPAGEGRRVDHGPGFWEIALAGDAEIEDPDAIGPPTLDVWTRFVGAPDDPTVNRALLAYATDGFLIATAMRPHPGVGQALAHVSVSTTVISHTLTFHEDVDAGQWMLLAHESPYAGRGRSYGRAHVYDTDDHLVASFVQENMIRDIPPDRRPAPGTKSAY